MTSETKVGLFTFFGLVLLGFSIYMLGNFTVSKGFDINVYFKNVSGLPAKSIVRLNGVEVGKVKELKLDGPRVAAVVRLNDGAVVYKNSRFSIAATSLIGTNYLQIDQGDFSSGILAEGDSVEGESMSSVTDMLAETMATINNLASGIAANGKFAEDLNATLENLRMLSGNLNELVFSLRPYLSSSMQDVSELTKASKELMAKIDGGDGLFTALVQDEQMKTDVQTTLANVRQVSEDAKQFIGKMAKFRIFWEYDARYQPDGNLTESDLGIKFVPANGFTYYRVGISDLGNRDNAPKDDKDYRGKPNQIDARLGLYNKWADLQVGMIRGAGGGILALKPFYKSEVLPVREFNVYGEVTDFGRNRVINNKLFDKPKAAIGARTFVTKNVGVGIRYNEMLEKDARALQLTGSLSFEDKELASMLGLATLAK
ncbi:MlaD family protein [Candidatus Proelusimicrobium excrementi]|uniref:MlaD family protein n=1 Tax=Candidatus Proelusimicrobium excrementi TaxID=3416222 RepID=UPI003D135098